MLLNEKTYAHAENLHNLLKLPLIHGLFGSNTQIHDLYKENIFLKKVLV